MDLWHSLTRRRSIPEVPAWMAATTLLFLAAYVAWLALRPAGPPVTVIRDPVELVQESRTLIADGEALMQAMRDNDQPHAEHLLAEMQARARREAERERARAAAVATARTWYGLFASLSFLVGGWLLGAAGTPREN